MHRTAGLAKCFLVLLTLALATPLAGAAYAADEGWLGVMLQPLTDDIIQAMDLEKGATGVLVSDVVEESPADRADLEKGDIIIEIDGIAIKSTDQAVEQVRTHSSGETVKMVILRDGKKEVVTAELGKRGEIEKSKVSRDTEDEGENEYYDIRIPRVERIFEGVKDIKLGKGGQIGIRIQDMTPDLSPYFGVGAQEGVLILEVTEGSPAAEAGLKGGDVVLKVDGKAVCCSQPLVECIRQHELGDKVEITLKRQGETRRMAVEVGEGPGIREIFMGEAGQPGMSMWQEEGPGGHMQKRIQIGEGCMGPRGKGMEGGKRKCIIIGDGCCDMMGKGMEECKRKCAMMGEKCKGMMGKRSGAGEHECMGMQKELMESMDKDPMKCFEKQSLDTMRPPEIGGDLKKEMEDLRHEIENLKKEIEELKES